VLCLTDHFFSFGTLHEASGCVTARRGNHHMAIVKNAALSISEAAQANLVEPVRHDRLRARRSLSTTCRTVSWRRDAPAPSQAEYDNLETHQCAGRSRRSLTWSPVSRSRRGCCINGRDLHGARRVPEPPSWWIDDAGVPAVIPTLMSRYGLFPARHPARRTGHARKPKIVQKRGGNLVVCPAA
jgi:hypothetical protein